jgi:hypothetical protein
VDHRAATASTISNIAKVSKPNGLMGSHALLKNVLLI